MYYLICLPLLIASHWSEAATKEFENLTNVGKWQPLKFKIFGQKGDFHKTLLSIDLLDEKSSEVCFSHY